jgi:NAD(P)H-flavin reductase
MSKYIDKLKIGDEVELMGPVGTVKYTPSLYKNVGLIAGGTGITPIYQILQHTLNDPKDLTRFTLLFANNQEKDILLRSELTDLSQKYSDRFKIHHVLVDPPASNNAFEKGFVTKQLIQKYLDLKSLVMVCGPPLMEDSVVNHLEQLGVKDHVAFTRAHDHVSKNPTPQVVTQSLEKEFTMEEVSKHDKEGDCWLVIHDKVYDITKFVDEHPGGYIILDGAGKDATELFEEEFPHTESAIDDLKKLQIGILKNNLVAKIDER